MSRLQQTSKNGQTSSLSLRFNVKKIKYKEPTHWIRFEKMTKLSLFRLNNRKTYIHTYKTLNIAYGKEPKKRFDFSNIIDIMFRIDFTFILLSL